jgi:hypothetical protein
MSTLTKKQASKINAVVTGFQLDGASDFNRMRGEILDATGFQVDNATTWALVNRAKSRVDTISFSIADLD